MRAEVGMPAGALVDFVARWGLGWRYILSRQFRRRVHAQWASRPRGDVAIDVAVLIVAFVALNGLVVLTGLWLYDGIAAAAAATITTTIGDRRGLAETVSAVQWASSARRHRLVSNDAQAYRAESQGRPAI
jgi:hypothetical protein